MDSSKNKNAMMLSSGSGYELRFIYVGGTSDLSFRVFPSLHWTRFVDGRLCFRMSYSRHLNVAAMILPLTMMRDGGTITNGGRNQFICPSINQRERDRFKLYVRLGILDIVP